MTGLVKLQCWIERCFRAVKPVVFLVSSFRVFLFKVSFYRFGRELNFMISSSLFS